MSGIIFILFLGVILPEPSLLTPEKAMKLVSQHPRIYWISRKLSVQNITSSWFFQLIPMFLFFSIFLCTLKRIKEFLKTKNRIIVPGNSWEKIVELTGSITLKHITAYLEKSGWFTAVSNNILSASKGRIGFLGSIVFHAGMLIAFAGFITSSLYGFRGSILFVQGHRTGLAESGFIRILKKPRFNPAVPEFFLTLEHYAATFDSRGTPVEYSSSFIFEDEDLNIRPVKIAINQPLKYKGFQATLQRHGVTPYFIIRDRERDRIIFDADVNLITEGDFFDMFNVDAAGMTVYAKFFPEMGIRDGTPFLVSREWRRPGFLLEVKDKNNKKFREFFYADEVKTLGEFMFSVKDIKHWVEIEVSKDSGIRIFITGFILIIAGLMVRFIDYDRNLFIKIEGDNLLLYGCARYFNETFRSEIDALKNGIRKII